MQNDPCFKPDIFPFQALKSDHYYGSYGRLKMTTRLRFQHQTESCSRFQSLTSIQRALMTTTNSNQSIYVSRITFSHSVSLVMPLRSIFFSKFEAYAATWMCRTTFFLFGSYFSKWSTSNQFFPHFALA